MATQDKAEVDRILANVATCRKTLQVLGDPDFMVDEFFFVSFVTPDFYLYLI